MAFATLVRSFTSAVLPKYVFACDSRHKNMHKDITRLSKKSYSNDVVTNRRKGKDSMSDENRHRHDANRVKIVSLVVPTLVDKLSLLNTVHHANCVFTNTIMSMYD